VCDLKPVQLPVGIDPDGHPLEVAKKAFAL
jgi:hypothetical protein